MRVLVLNADYTFLNIINIKKALRFIQAGKVVVERTTEELIKTVSGTIPTPLVVRFIKFVRRMFKHGVRWAKKRVLIRDNNTCMYCGSVQGKMTVDHIIPTSRGGKGVWENTVCCCGTCNAKKADKTPREAGLALKTKPIQPTVSEYLMKRLFNEEARAMLDAYFKTF